MPKSFFQAIAVVILALWGSACGDKECRIPEGRWTNREGQVFVFQPNGKGLWLTRFGSVYDTVTMRYRIDCSTDPLQIDMDEFKGALYEGKQFYGILEWSSDTSFRMLYEIGSDPSDRPSTFEGDLTQKFFKE
jgi:hypothetical protein